MTNYQAASETLKAPGIPNDRSWVPVPMPFGPELYIERDDFSLAPPRKWKRLSPGAFVRLRLRLHPALRRGGDRCRGAGSGTALQLRSPILKAAANQWYQTRRCDPWVAAATAVAARMQLYGRLCRVPVPRAATLMEDLNPDSLVTTQALSNRPLPRAGRGVSNLNGSVIFAATRSCP